MDRSLSFRFDWEPEFANSSFNTLSLKTSTMVVSVFLSFSVTQDHFVFDLAFACLPKLMSVGAFVVIFIYLLRSCQERCMQNYNLLCSIVAITIYVTVMWCQYNAKCGEMEAPTSQQRTHYSGASNPDEKFRLFDRTSSSPLILPTACYYYALVSLLPTVLKMSPISATLVTIVECIILIIFCILNTVEWFDLVFVTAFQASAGLAAAHVCRSRLRVAREHFALAKAAKFAAEQTSNRLHTLIPMQVLPALTSHTGKEMLGALIPHCTVMFCSLHLDPAPSMSLADRHQLLDGVFSALDDAVRRSGMFKYQHVGEWYIVACPRAAAPFDTDLQERPYPAAHVSAMFRLATELQVLSTAVSAGDRKQRC